MLDKTNVNTIVTIIGIIVTIVSIIIGISINWLWACLTLALLFDLGLIILRRRKFQKIINALKPKPKLKIVIQDITCYVSTEFRQEDQNPRAQSHHIALDIVSTVKITNLSKAMATQVLGEMKLTIRQGGDSFCCKSKRTVHTYKLARTDKPRQERIVFDRKYFLQQDFIYYPNAVYSLDYIYQCREQSNKELIATYSGILAKADWVGQMYIPETRCNESLVPAHWAHDEDVLKLIRRIGFTDPS
jgi:hypothetical protein